MGRRDQLPGFEVAFLAGGDQHRRLAVGRRRAESHVGDPGVVGGRDGGVERKTVNDTEGAREINTKT